MTSVVARKPYKNVEGFSEYKKVPKGAVFILNQSRHFYIKSGYVFPVYVIVVKYVHDNRKPYQRKQLLEVPLYMGCVRVEFANL